MVLRVLALHGFGQSAAIFAEKRIKELTRKLKSVVEFHCLDAPHVLPYDSNLRGWWTYPEDLWDGRAETIQGLAEQMLQRQEFSPKGLKESLQLVLEEWGKGGYDGILGFSQGAILATALCAELLRRGPAAGPPPGFAILVSGFGRPVPCGLEGYPPQEPMQIPSLHMWGEGDDHIPPWASETLVHYYFEPRTYTHPGHHFVPQKVADVAVFKDFLSTFTASPSKPLATSAAAAVADQPAAAVTATASVPAQRAAAAVETGTAATATVAAQPPAATLPIGDELARLLQCYRAPMNREAPPPRPTASTPQGTDSSAAPVTDEELQAPGPATYERLVRLLKEASVEFAQLGPHGPCRTSEDAVRIRLEGGWEGTTLHSGAKAMLLKAHKGSWLLAVMPADCKLSWKKVRALHGKGTRMATEEEVQEVTGCLPGAVPPLASAFPADVQCLADDTLPSVINFNCGLRSRSIRLLREDYERVQSPTIVDLIE